MELLSIKKIYSEYNKNKHISFRFNYTGTLSDFIAGFKKNIEREEGYTLKYNEKRNKLVIGNSLLDRGTWGISFIAEIKYEPGNMQINGAWTNNNIEIYFFVFMAAFVLFFVSSVPKFFNAASIIFDIIFPPFYSLGGIFIIYGSLLSRTNFKKTMLKKIASDLEEYFNSTQQQDISSN